MALRLTEQLAGPDPTRHLRQLSWTAQVGLTHDQIGRVRRWLVVAGSLALLVGVASIAVPVIASVTAAIFVGWVLLASGIAAAIYAISHRAPLRGLEALVALAAGFYLLVFPLHGTVTLTFVLAVWFFASGVFSLAYALQWRRAPGWWLSALAGVSSIVLGFLIAASLPSSAAWAIGLLVGINLIFWGVRALLGARLLKALDEAAGRT
jgi:uncharacterized membrane protein HdeD (DUF308 family)